MKQLKYWATAIFRIFVSMLLLFFSFTKAFCFENEAHFKHYNNKQGLSHNTVYCALQDHRGFMWFGTDEGLNRFDGHTFKVYRHNSTQPNSLPNDRIISLFEDSAGRLRVCTETITCMYDYATDAFTPIALPNEKACGNRFFAVREDLQKNLWFCNNDRIVRYTEAENKVCVYPRGEYFSPVTITITQTGNVLFAGAHDVYIYQSGKNDFLYLPVLTDSEKEAQVEITTLCEAPNETVFVGTNKAGLKRFSPITQTVETIIPDIQVRSVYPKSENEYWIASESGLYIYNTQNRSIVNLRKSLTNEYSIADNAVYSLVKDREGGMWVGSFFGGVSYLPKEYTHFNLYIGGKTHMQMLGNAVREICPDQYGNLWLGTEDNGINKYDLRTGEMTNFSANNTRHPLSATNIHGLLPDGNRLWVGTFNKGIDVLDIPSGKIIKRYTRESTHGGLRNDFILSLFRTRSGNILIGTASGVVQLDEKTDTFSSWNNITSLIRQFYEDKSGTIWVVSTSGLYRYIPQKDELTLFSHREQDEGSLNSNNVTSVFEDSKSRIWVTTISGFALFNPATGNFKRISIEHGLPSNLVYRILEDDANNLWISTANGLVRFNPETSAIRVFAHTDGLYETQFNYSSSYKSPLGTMYMGTINGLISFNPQLFTNDTFSPPIHITNIQSDVIQLPYDSSTFTLSYIALSFTSPEAIQYKYKLEGVDKDWVSMGHNRNVTFANLSPGKYVFKVQSTNSSGIWQENTAELRIIITPPFWATGWAYAAYSILVLLLIRLFYGYKKAKLEEKHRVSQQLFEGKKEKELYNAKIQFFTFITHEIRTPLTLIKAPLEKIIRSGDGNASTRESLRIMEKNTGRLLELSNQLLDFRKTESKGFKLNFVQTDVTCLLEEVIHQFQSNFTAAGKLLSVSVPIPHLVCAVDREALSKIISNLLSNALKYSQKVITLHLYFGEEEPTFRIAVQNDGRLISEAEKEKIFEPFYRSKESENIVGSGMGLSLARSLAEFHNGTLSYSYTPEGLNQFSLVLPREHATAFTGLRVESGESESVYPASTSSQTHRFSVLIVEDQPDMRQFIAGELSELYNVLEAGNGKEALDILKSKPVNVIVSDVMMPVMDGFEFCNRVKNDLNYSHLPFIILTAQHNLQSRLEGLNNGADAYIEKPFSTDLLMAQVSNLLKSREQLNRTYLEKPLTPLVALASSKIDDLFLEKFHVLLDENLCNSQLSVETLAEGMSMSTSSLYRKVKGISDLSPVDFIRVARLKKAVQLMQAGESRMSEIAFQVGFSSPSYFSNCFQKQYGIPPSEFIKEGGAK